MRLSFFVSAICSAGALLLAGCDHADPQASADASSTPAPAAAPDPTVAAPAVAPDASLATPDVAASGDSAATVSFNAAQTADSEVWYTTSEGATACTTATSPTQEVDRLQAQGTTATTADNNAADGTLIDVVVRWNDNGGSQAATYYRKLGDCEATLPQAQVIPDRYKR